MATVVPTAVSSIPSNTETVRPVMEKESESILSEYDSSVPVIDYSKLTSSDPQEHSTAIKELEKACNEWGGFLVINHGVPDGIMKALFEGYGKFFDLPLEEKSVYEPKSMLQPIMFRHNLTSDGSFQRDCLTTWLTPEFHFPTKPEGNSEIVREFYKRTHAVFLGLLSGISETLGMEPNYLEKILDVNPGATAILANMYPQEEKLTGIPVHTDGGLFFMLIENEIGGLQFLHKNQWVEVNLPPNSFVVNFGDLFEIVTNGKYKSLEHRAIVNNKKTRISVAFATGPTPDTVIGPAKELMERDGTAPAYKSMSHKEYLEMGMNIPSRLKNMRL